MRNPYYKGCIKGKDISVIRYNKDIIQNHVCIDSPTDFLVMNSVSNLKKCLVELERYIAIHCYLDNDLAGRKTVETIAGLCGNRVTDHSECYYNYKDLNDYLRGKRR